MRNLLVVAVICLLAGISGAIAYSHFLGEGRELADVRDQLAAAKALNTKSAAEGHELRSETEALTAQVNQLSSTNDGLKHQVSELKSANGGVVTDASAPTPNPMANMVKAAVKQQHEEKLQLLRSRLHLTPEQETQLQAAMDAESKVAEEMATKMMQGGKIDPTALIGANRPKSVDQTLDEILTPEQKTAYQQLKDEQKISQAQTMATMEMNQEAPLLQLTEAQKDQVYSALYQAQVDSQDPAWIKSHPADPANPSSFLDVQAQAKEAALAKVLTPEQLATYHQKAQSQLEMQKAMMQKFMHPAPGAAPVTPAAP